MTLVYRTVDGQLRAQVILTVGDASLISVSLSFVLTRENPGMYLEDFRKFDIVGFDLVKVICNI